MVWYVVSVSSYVLAACVRVGDVIFPAIVAAWARICMLR
jgi:hypothetical protein